MKRNFAVSVALFAFGLICVLLSACQRDDIRRPLPEQRAPLRIGYLSEAGFEQRYARPLALAFPDLRLEIEPLAPLVKGQIPLDEWAQSNRIDLLYVPGTWFQPMIDKGMLQNLDTLLSEDGSFSLDPFLPSTIRLSEAYGQGSLYGIAPSFFSSAVAYNRSLFAQSGVPFPPARPSWEDLLLLAQRFDRGLAVSAPSPFHWLWSIGRTQQLKMIDVTTNQLLLDQPAWEKSWTLAAEALREGHVVLESANEFAFPSGEWAMAVVSYEAYKRLEQSPPPFDWSLVSMPTDPAHPGQSPFLVADGFWAIARGAEQPETAWAVMKFFLTEQVARWEYRSNYGFSALHNAVALQQSEQEKLAAFYDVLPVPPRSESIPDDLPGLVNAILGDVMEQHISVAEGWERLEEMATERNRDRANPAD